MIRLTPFDVSIPAGRSKERLRRVVLSTGAGVGARLITLLVALISVPLTINYLGIERYGLWVMINSMLLMLLGLAELGMGNGLVNAVSQAHGQDDRQAAQQAVSSTFFFLIAIALLGVIIFFVLYPFISWPRIFNVTSNTAVRESGPAMVVFIFCFALKLPLGVAQRVQMGYQEGYLGFLWLGGASVLGFIALLLAIRFGAGLPLLVLILAGAPVLAAAMNFGMEFGKRHTWLIPSPRRILWSTSKTILGSGLLFFAMTTLLVLGTATDNLIITQVLGPEAVASYAVTQRLFMSLAFFSLASAALWPAFSEALTRSDYVWARRAFKQSILFGMGISMATVIPLVLFGQLIIGWWAGAEVVPGRMLLVGWAAWFLVFNFGAITSSVLNSKTTLVRKQVVLLTLASISSLVLKIILVHYWQSAGVIWGGVLGYAVFMVIPFFVVARAALGQPLGLSRISDAIASLKNVFTII